MRDEGAFLLELPKSRIAYMEQVLKEKESYGKSTYNFRIWGISMTLPHWTLSPFTLSMTLMDSDKCISINSVKRGVYYELLSSRSMNNWNEPCREEGCIISFHIKILMHTDGKCSQAVLSDQEWGFALFPDDLHKGVMLMPLKDDSVSG